MRPARFLFPSPRSQLALGIVLVLLVAPLARAQTDATNAAPPTSPDPSQSPTAQTAPVYTAPASSSIAPAGNPGANPQEDISDIRPPFFFLHGWFYFWLALAVAALIALIILVWKWLRRPAFLSPKSAYDLTLEKLEKAHALLREEDPVPYAVFVSETIRSYLGQRFQTPSTLRTTEEFLRIMEADQGTPLAEHSDLLRNFLQACDLVKFAKYQPTQLELEEVQQRAFTFVHATKPVSQSNGRTP